MRKFLVATMIVAAFTAAAVTTVSPVAAQQIEKPSASLQIKPFVGTYFDKFVGTDYISGPSGRRETKPGVFVGVGLGYNLTERIRLTGNLGYSKVENFGLYGPDAENHFVYGNKNLFATGGVAYDLLPGRTRFSVGVEAGAVADAETREAMVGAPSQVVRTQYENSVDGSYGLLHAVIVPNVTLGRQIASGVSIELGARDYIFLDDSELSGRPDELTP